MIIADQWKDYEIIASGNGEKLERWGEIFLLRPDPQVIWPTAFDLNSYKGLHARYIRNNKGGGHWELRKQVPDEWNIRYKSLKFSLKLMGFKHVGIFPEQAANWEKLISIIKKVDYRPQILNLFAYTGGASVALAAAGAKVTHVDAARGMVDRAKQNAMLSNAPTDGIRYIVDDCAKFVKREIKRGIRYDGIIMDPPSYGRGPNGELWKIEDDLFSLVSLCKEVLSQKPLFFLINSYTTGLSPVVLTNILDLCLSSYKGESIGYDLCLPTNEKILLPCGCSGIFIAKHLDK